MSDYGKRPQRAGICRVEFAVVVPIYIACCVMRRDISIVFADLRGTTGISQRLPAADMLALLNEFHRTMIDEVIKAGATVDKILGDGLMILVGAPVREQNHPAKAVELGIALQRAYHGVRRDLGARGLPTPGMGVGIATGEVVIGNVGSEMRLDYTAIGAEVNVSSKLCGAAAGTLLSHRRRERLGTAAVCCSFLLFSLPMIGFQDRAPLRDFRYRTDADGRPLEGSARPGTDRLVFTREFVREQFLYWSDRMPKGWWPYPPVKDLERPRAEIVRGSARIEMKEEGPARYLMTVSAERPSLLRETCLVEVPALR